MEKGICGKTVDVALHEVQLSYLQKIHSIDEALVILQKEPSSPEVQKRIEELAQIRKSLDIERQVK